MHGQQHRSDDVVRLWLVPAAAGVALAAAVALGTSHLAGTIVLGRPLLDLPEGRTQCPWDVTAEEDRLVAELLDLTDTAAAEVEVFDDCDSGSELSVGTQSRDLASVERWEALLRSAGWERAVLDERDAHPDDRAWVAPAGDLAVVTGVDQGGRDGPVAYLSLFVPHPLG